MLVSLSLSLSLSHSHITSPLTTSLSLFLTLILYILMVQFTLHIYPDLFMVERLSWDVSSKSSWAGYLTRNCWGSTHGTSGVWNQSKGNTTWLSHDLNSFWPCPPIISVLLKKSNLCCPKVKGCLADAILPPLSSMIEHLTLTAFTTTLRADCGLVGRSSMTQSPSTETLTRYIYNNAWDGTWQLMLCVSHAYASNCMYISLLPGHVHRYVCTMDKGHHCLVTLWYSTN